MALALLPAEYAWGNTASIVPYPYPKLPFFIQYSHFDPVGTCMPKCIAQGFHCNPVDLVAQHRMQIPWCTFGLEEKSRRISARGTDCAVRHESLSLGRYGRRQIA